MRFHDRTDAGKKLAQEIARQLGAPKNLIILGLPRGGIPVGLEIARELKAPFDIFLVRKLGTPGHEELAMGALAYGGVVTLNEDIIHNLRIPKELIEIEIRKEQQELERRNSLYRSGGRPPEVKGKSVILVDDGVATGASARAAIAALRKQVPAQIIVAVPVAPQDVYDTLAEADKIICLATPEPFYGVGMHYDNFSQLTDNEVKMALAKAA
jgi:putative phosphoribosyl transferase